MSRDTLPEKWSKTRLAALWGATTMLGAWILYRLYIVIGHAWPFTTDDAYITLRYARHLAEGKGIMWNPGDFPVEGYSNFLYVLIGAASFKLGWDPVIAVKFIGAVSLVATCVLSFLIARRWVNPLGALLPALLFTGYRGTSLWAVSGMETAFYVCLAMTAIWLFIQGCESAQIGIRSTHNKTTPKTPTWTLSQRFDPPVLFALCGGTLLLAAMTRLEGPIFGIIALGSLTVVGATRFIKPRLRGSQEFKPIRPIIQAVSVLLGTFVLPYTVYFAWRWHYFGRFLPNTYYCKANASGDPWTLLGWYWDDAFLFVLLALLFPWRKLDIRSTTLIAVVLAYIALLYGADTIVAYEMRLAMVAFAALCILGSVSALSWANTAWRSLPSRLAAFVVVVAILVWQGQLDDTTKYLDDYSGRYAKRMELRAELGDWVDERLGPDDWFIIGDAGIAPFHTDAKIADPFCLNSWRFTSDDIRKDMSIYVNWAITLKPKIIAVHSRSAHRLKPRGEYDFYPKLVADPRFQEAYKLTKKFSPGKGVFHYWIYTRK